MYCGDVHAVAYVGIGARKQIDIRGRKFQDETSIPNAWIAAAYMLFPV